MKYFAVKLKLASVISTLVLSLFSIQSIPVNAASGSITINNTTTFSSADPIDAAQMYVVVCNSSNQPLQYLLDKLKH